MATWLIKGKAKKTALFYFLFLRKKVEKDCQKWLQNGCFLKKKAFLLLLFLTLLRVGSSKWAEVFFCCIKCIKMILLSHTNQILNIFSNFYLQRLWRRWQCWHGVSLSGPKPAKHSVAPAMKAVLISLECYKGVKISKCSNNMYPKTP